MIKLKSKTLWITWAENEYQRYIEYIAWDEDTANKMIGTTPMTDYSVKEYPIFEDEDGELYSTNNKIIEYINKRKGTIYEFK